MSDGCGCGSEQCETQARQKNLEEDLIRLTEDLANILDAGGYPSAVAGKVINSSIVVEGKKFPTAFHVGNNNALVVCPVATVADGGETFESQANFLYNCLDLNDQIAPFALSIIKSDDLEGDNINEGDAPVVALVYQISYRSGSVDIGTLMDNLRRAIMTTMDRLSAVVAA